MSGRAARSREGEVAVVLGAAGGLGFEMARRFAHNGANLVISDVNADALAATEQRLVSEGYDVVAVHANVAFAEDIDVLATTTWARFGRVDMVCNTVGVYSQGAAWELSLQDWRWHMDVNFWGVLHGIRAFVPLMLRQGDGHIVNTASSITLTSRADFAAYDASKHGVLSLSESLQHDLRAAGSDITVSLMIPGAIRSQMYEGSKNRPAEYGQTTLPQADQEDMRIYLEQHGADPEVLASILGPQLDERRFYVFGRPEDMEYAERTREDLLTGTLSDSPFQRRPGPGAQALTLSASSQKDDPAL